ncbi:UNKNOWN [Stylonychia lemnae]|uniref:Uncharacterized protein n=1 Tax=Stylonychia lemnae TaxID=5949 RepID=A0A078APG5_STYLE|nr:UNKNOWN [Stylonychia lemnae]|eukprot:CDW84034.1 UNKNOWN [Stylonychia lemnae]
MRILDPIFGKISYIQTIDYKRMRFSFYNELPNLKNDLVLKASKQPYLFIKLNQNDELTMNCRAPIYGFYSNMQQIKSEFKVFY